MDSRTKYWLIYAFIDMNDLGRQAKPFPDKDVMDRWINRNRDDIIVISRTKELNE